LSFNVNVGQIRWPAGRNVNLTVNDSLAVFDSQQITRTYSQRFVFANV